VDLARPTPTAVVDRHPDRHGSANPFVERGTAPNRGRRNYRQLGSTDPDAPQIPPAKRRTFRRPHRQRIIASLARPGIWACFSAPLDGSALPPPMSLLELANQPEVSKPMKHTPAFDLANNAVAAGVAADNIPNVPHRGRNGMRRPRTKVSENRGMPANQNPSPKPDPRPI